MLAEIGNMYLNNDNKIAIPGQDPELDDLLSWSQCVTLKFYR